MQTEYAKKVFTGEVASMTALYNALPEMVPKPIGMGKYAKDEESTGTYFFVCEFKEMFDEMPDKEQLCEKLALLHQRGVSPDGKFGFPVATYGSRIPRIHIPSDTWEALFTDVMETMFDTEERTQGPDEDVQMLRKGITEKVIPRLIRPMETNGRKLVPRLVHSDLWHGNIGIDVKTNSPVIFDALALYAHNEYELAPWRPIRHNIGRPYMEEYLKHFPKTEPAGDFDDRNLLYCM